MDCTGSMSSWIRECQENIVTLIDQVRQRTKISAKIRIGYVGYRDFGDSGDEEHFDILRYTEDVEAAKRKIKSSSASGGGDAPEDVIGALQKGLKFKHEASTLLVYLIADAPSHGRQYHEGYGDDHPNVPEGKLEDLIRQYKEPCVGMNTFFTAIKINDSTNIMFDKMHAAFGEGFAQTDRQLTKHFYQTMFNTMSRSIEETKSRTLSKVLHGVNPKFQGTNEEVVSVMADYELPHIPPLPVPEKIDLDYWKNLVKESRSKAEKGRTFLKIISKEVGTGTTSKTYEVRDTSKNCNMVVKIDLKVFNGDTK